ncbi:MAG: YicC family protein [Planctomycetes bacterium]|nr:YicC family protein [Planctomycetota bacterium]
MRSMTGFGSASRSERGLALRAEVRAVNHKFLQLKLRLPDELGALEAEVEARVRERLERGAVNLNVALDSGVALAPIELDLALAQRYRELLEKLNDELRLGAKLGIDDIARLPGVFRSAPDSAAVAAARSVLFAVVDAALDALGEMREREGAVLSRDLGLRGATIAAIVERIRTRMPLVVRAHQENLQRRVAELLGPGTALAPADLAREIALIADRLDVTEELTRLASHLGQLQALCAKRTPVGRQLDFLVQEFLREANTIGSKCNDAEVAHAVVELKTEIERLREQVQNVE